MPVIFRTPKFTHSSNIQKNKQTNKQKTVMNPIPNITFNRQPLAFETISYLPLTLFPYALQSDLSLKINFIILLKIHSMPQ